MVAGSVPLCPVVVKNWNYADRYTYNNTHILHKSINTFVLIDNAHKVVQ